LFLFFDFSIFSFSVFCSLFNLYRYDLLISTSADPEADLRRYQYSGGGASEPEPVTSEPVGTYSAANPFNDADTETSPEHTQSFLSEKNDFPVATPISKGDEDSSQLL